VKINTTNALQGTLKKNTHCNLICEKFAMKCCLSTTAIGVRMIKSTSSIYRNRRLYRFSISNMSASYECYMRLRSGERRLQIIRKCSKKFHTWNL